MIDYTELKRLVEAGSLPPIVSTLIAENERIDGCCKAMALDMGKLTRERNSFRSSAEKLKAENERLAAACERAEQIIIVECKAASLAKVRANLLEANRDQLRAEVAGLRTGYEAYERVNAELKAENERLERNRDMWKGQVDRQCETIEGLRKALKAAEDAMWHADGNMDGEAADARDALAALGQGEQS